MPDVLINTLFVFCNSKTDVICLPAHLEKIGNISLHCGEKAFKYPVELCSILKMKLSKQSCRVGFIS